MRCMLRSFGGWLADRVARNVVVLLLVGLPLALDVSCRSSYSVYCEALCGSVRSNREARKR